MPSIQPSIVHWRMDPFDDLTLIHSPLNPSISDRVRFPVIIDPDPNSKSLQSPILLLPKTSGVMQSTTLRLEVICLPFASRIPPVEQHWSKLQNVNDNSSFVPAYLVPQSVLICNSAVSVRKM